MIDVATKRELKINNWLRKEATAYGKRPASGVRRAPVFCVMSADLFELRVLGVAAIVETRKARLFLAAVYEAEHPPAEVIVNRSFLGPQQKVMTDSSVPRR